MANDTFFRRLEVCEFTDCSNIDPTRIHGVNAYMGAADQEINAQGQENVSPSRRPIGRFIKRVFDLAIAGIGGLVLMPIMGTIALLILLADGRPIFFTQIRIGLGGIPFKIYKFRTMILNAEAWPHGTVTVSGDPRLLPFAPILRTLKLDEVPQILNVINGTMSIVGPRPTTANDVERMTADQRRRHDILPGLTGLAQVSGHAQLLWPARIEYDLRYRNSWSFWLDVEIVWRTLILILSGKAELPPSYSDEWGDSNAKDV